MRRLLVVVGLILIGFAGLAQAQFCPGVAPYVFDDVLASDSLCPDITWMALNNITLGCKALGGVDLDYCPNDSVTRKQMAAFMFRLGKVRVQEVDTGPGLTGGPITLTGTIGLTATQLLPTTACASGQLPQWNGSKWICASVGGSGTVTSIAGGTGIVASPSPIIGSGTLNLALSYQLPQACTNGQVAKSNGSGGWICATDSNSGGTVTSVTAGAGLLGGTITSSGTIAVDPASVTLTGNFFKQGGNAFGATAVLGTTDSNAVEIDVNGSRAMRYEPNATSPNVIGGYVNNGVYLGVVGAGIAGGGAAGALNDLLLGFTCALAYGCLNGVTDAFGTIGGGAGNQAGDGVGTTSDATFATVAGGFSNWARNAFSSVGGGVHNSAGGTYSTVAGGIGNTASGSSATVAGGAGNTASGVDATVAGGGVNTASGVGSTVAGGYNNSAGGDYSLAAGYGAVIPASASGSFLWSSASTGGTALPAGAHDEFVVVATNGIGFYTYGDFSHGCALVGLAGSWSCTSDRATKSGFTSIEPRDILARLVEMPITQWRWKGEAETVRHVGPTAQDFRAAFGLGYDDKTITLVDTEGVALAAIQGLNAKLEERIADKERQIVEQQSEIAELRDRLTEVESLRGELAALRNAIAAATRGATIAAQARATAP